MIGIAILSQADRNAAADHFERIEPFGLGFLACAIRDGRRDDDLRVRQFVAAANGVVRIEL